MPHLDEVLSLQANHARRTDNPHATTGSQLGLGVMQSTSGTVAGAASGSINNIFAAPSIVNGTYLVCCGLSAADPANYSAVAIVSDDNAVLRQTNLQTAALLVISVSGSNIRVQQNSGAGANIFWTITRLS